MAATGNNPPHDTKATIPLTQTSGFAPSAPTFMLSVYHRDGASFVPLPADSAVVVGREPPADVVLTDSSLSRQHARFVHDDDGLWVQDLGSTNGTKVRGEPVSKARFTPGLAVNLGAVVCTVYVRQTDDPALEELEGHDGFMVALERAVARARYFDDAASVLMIRAFEGKGRSQHVSSWYQRALKALRNIDVLGSYSGQILELLLPRAGKETALNQAEVLVKAVKDGDVWAACGVATYPFSGTDAQTLLENSRRALEQTSAKTPVNVAAGEQFGSGNESASETFMIAESPPMKALLATIERVAQANLPVLLLGETGTGKELVARTIHGRGPRRKGAFVGLNCGAIPPQLVESTLFGHERGAFTGADKASKGVLGTADGGTVLLDEIGDLPLDAQTSLLRALETGCVTPVGSAKELPVDVRVLAATHRDLEAMSAKGEFRSDLLYRINAMTLPVPPLRQRRDDIAPLALYFLEQASAAAGAREVNSISQKALEALRRFNWPGNIRELRNVVERACVVADHDRIELDDLPERVRGAQAARAVAPPGDSNDDSAVDLRTRVRRYEANQLIAALRATGGNQTHAARNLGLPLRTLIHKIKTLGIEKTDYRD